MKKVCSFKVVGNEFQLYAVVVFIVMLSSNALKLIKDILFKVIHKATIAYKLLLHAFFISAGSNAPIF